MILKGILKKNILNTRNTAVLLFMLCVSNLIAQTADQRANHVQDATNAIFMSFDESYYKHNSMTIKITKTIRMINR